MRISPQLLADLGGNRSQLLERRPRSAHPYEGPRSGRSSRLAELPSVGVGDPIEVPRESIEVQAVKTPRSTQRQSKLYGVCSCGAWEGRLHPRGRGTSLYRGERRRRRTSSSSSSSGERYLDKHSPLATPLHGGGSDRGEPHYTTPRSRRQSTERSMRVQWRCREITSRRRVRRRGMRWKVLMQDKGPCSKSRRDVMNS